MTIPAITVSIGTIASGTDVWFVDIWGVLHNGVRPFDAAVQACRRFRAGGGIVVLVSNAPRPASAVADQLDRIGVARDAYDAIRSSGDTARAMICDLVGRRVLHIGPDRDLPLFDGIPLILSPPAGADAIVCTGLADDETETADSYRSMLAPLAASGARMVCANPDLTVERGGRIIPCAGAIAAVYETLGGRVDYAGKPHPPIYESAFSLVDTIAGRAVSRSRILAIGDGVRTDIAGAARVGLRSVYIVSGVSLDGALDDAALLRLFPDPTVRPVAAMAALAW